MVFTFFEKTQVFSEPVALPVWSCLYIMVAFERIFSHLQVFFLPILSSQFDSNKFYYDFVTDSINDFLNVSRIPVQGGQKL